MQITVRKIESNDPYPGLSVSAPGGWTGITDANGQVTAPSGTEFTIMGHARFVFSDAEDREVWIESGMSPPPPPPPPMP